MKLSNTKLKISGIVLCGGKSRRMGQNKSLMKIGNKTIIEIIIDNIKPLCDEILLSTNSNDFDYLPYPKIKDLHSNIGPLAGFYACLKNSSNNLNIIVSGDTPFISTSLLAYLIEQSDNERITLFKYQNHLQPMSGFFPKKIHTLILDNILNSCYKPILIFEKTNLIILDIDKKTEFSNSYALFNINTYEDYLESIIIAKKYYKHLF